MPDYDDDDRREDYDRYDRDDRYDDRDDGVSDRIVHRARSKVSAPGMILIIFGLIGMLLEIGMLSLAVTQPFFMYDAVRKMYESQPPGKARDDSLKQWDTMKDQLRMDSPLNLGSYSLGLVLSLLMIVGGSRMRSLKSYGLAMTGAIIGIIPLAGCSCCAMPIGIWAVVVLCNGDVKEAFRHVARRSY